MFKPAMFKSEGFKIIAAQWPLIFLGSLVSLVVIAIGVFDESIKHFLRYDSLAIIDKNEYWRLITAHFTHLGWSHLWLNLAGLALIFVFFATCVRIRYWLLTFIISSFTISTMILLFNPEIRWYVGLSGVLHALFIVGGIADIQKRKWEGITFTAIILAKVIYEQIAGPLPGSEEAAGGPVLVDAHFYGAMTGLVLAIPLLFQLWKNQKK